MGDQHVDPVEFGRVLARLDEQDATIAEMRQDIKALLELANRSKGAMFVLMGASSVLGTIFGAWAHAFMGRAH